MEIKSGTIVNSKYEVVKQIGEGGTALVYLARDLSNNDKPIVLKVSRGKHDSSVSSMDKRFLLEAKSLVKYNNPNIIKVHEFFEWNKKYVIVMEYVQGRTLKEVIQRERTIKPKKTVEIIIQVLQALKDIHKDGIIHRDIKPHNVMITTDNVVKLMDFGIVKASVDQDLTKTGNVIGTIEYMSPEQIKDFKALPQSEIYSLGIVMYYMLTGRLPFDSINGDMLELAKKHLYEKPVNPRKYNSLIDPILDGIIMKTLEKDYFNRYSSAEEMITVLQNYLKITNFEDPKAWESVKLKEASSSKKGLLKKIFGK